MRILAVNEGLVDERKIETLRRMGHDVVIARSVTEGLARTDLRSFDTFVASYPPVWGFAPPVWGFARIYASIDRDLLGSVILCVLGRFSPGGRYDPHDRRRVGLVRYHRVEGGRDLQRFRRTVTQVAERIANGRLLPL